jgi:mRNA interferase RelE/StbE
MLATEPNMPAGVYRYRFGNYRLFYTIEKEKIIVAILDIKHRQKAYD